MQTVNYCFWFIFIYFPGRLFVSYRISELIVGNLIKVLQVTLEIRH